VPTLKFVLVAVWTLLLDWDGPKSLWFGLGTFLDRMQSMRSIGASYVAKDAA